MIKREKGYYWVKLIDDDEYQVAYFDGIDWHLWGSEIIYYDDSLTVTSKRLEPIRDQIELD